jgi:hypothetical protein
MTTSQFGARNAFFVPAGQRFAFTATPRKKPNRPKLVLNQCEKQGLETFSVSWRVNDSMVKFR